MQEAEQQIYLNLVQELLNCLQGEELELLATKPELVNQQLVETLFLVAETRERDGKDNVPWLRGFAWNLAGRLGLELIAAEEGQVDSEDFSQEYLDFLKALITAELNDSSQVQQLFAQNLQQLTPQLGTIMKWFMGQVLAGQPANAKYYATLIYNILIRLSDFLLGNRAQNIEILIAGYTAVLTAITKENNPEQWARTQNQLGNAYCDRIRGDKADNLEWSISCYQLALEIYTQADFLIDWAMIQQNLGITYSERIRGNKADNLEWSISCYQLALEIYTQADFPIQWAITQHNLGATYRQRIKGDKAENLERSIACYQLELEICTQADFPIDWAITQNNLANTYTERIRGDRSENLELSIISSQLALKIRTQADFPIDWAMTQNNLGIAYSDRIRGDKAENLELSIDCYQLALKIRTQADFPIDWADTQNNLAVAYSKRIRGSKAENLEQSISSSQLALEIYTQTDFPIKWAMIQNNLAVVYRDRIRGDKAENLELSISSSQLALEIYTQTDFPIDWAMTHNNLALAYSDRLRGDRAENLEQSIKCCQLVLEICTPQSLPIKCLGVAQNLGNIHFNEENWQEAIDAYVIAITAVELSRSWANSEQSKQKIIEKAIEVYFSLVQCCINTQQYDKALEYAERSKSRNLVELLATRDLYPKGDIPADILSQLDTLRRQVLSEERRLNQRRDFSNSIDPGSRSITNQNTTGIDPDRERLFTLKQDLDNLIIDRVQPIDPSFQLTQQVQSIDFATMQSALPNAQTALLTWYISSNQIHTFLVTPFHNQPHVINSTPEQYQALDHLRATYLDTYRTDKQTWRETLPNLLQQISQIINLPEIITKLLQLNPDSNQIILIPHRILHLLPLHALPLNEAGDCLLDLFPGGVSYAPSIQLLKLSQQWHRPALQRLFAIQNPTNDLKYTDVEVPAICDRFQPNVEIVKGTQANKTALSSESLIQANCVHFSCHGSFNFENPLASALILSGGTTDLDKCLTLGEIFQLDLRHCGLVTLSACETGLTDFRSTGDEYIGLPSGFLYAGSSNVVSSLWAVSDLSTTFLMIKFYQNLKEADSVAIALNQAQKWLRQITKSELLDWITLLNLGSSKKLLVESWTDTLKSVDDLAVLFQSPYHWAAFCAIG